VRAARVLAVVAVSLGGGHAATAEAHVRSGTVAVDFRAHVDAAPAGVGVRIDPSDRALRLIAPRAARVVVLGSQGEPVRRLAPGVSATFHDARLRPPAPGIERRRWTVPLVVGRRSVALTGSVERVDAPPAWPWLPLVAPLLAAALWDRALVALGALAAAATLATATVFALDDAASTGTLIESADEAAFTLVALAFLVRGRGMVRAAAVGALGTLAIFAGLTKATALTRGVVLAAVPDTAARALVVLALAAGTAAMVSAVRCFLYSEQ